MAFPDFPAPSVYADFVDRVLTNARLPDPLTLHHNPSDVLWHYTDFVTFEKIVRGEKIWLGPLDKLDDHQEGRWLMSSLDKRLWALGDDRMFLGSIRAASEVSETYSFSLSGNSDRLSQWRAYADGGRGVAIGFQIGSLAKSINFSAVWSDIRKRTILVPVLYRNNAQLTPVTNELYQIVSELKRNYDDFKATLPPDAPMKAKATGMTFLPWANHFYQSMRCLEPMFKNIAFEEEDEWRIIYFAEHLGLSSALQHPPMHYRLKSTDMIPYYEYDVRGAICAVKLGPLCKASESVVSWFLNDTLKKAIIPSRSAATLIAR